MIEVTVTLKNLSELEAELAKMFEEARAKMASGEIEPEPEPEQPEEPEIECATILIDGVEHKVLGSPE